MLNALYKSVVSTVGNVAGLGGLPSSMKFHITKKVDSHSPLIIGGLEDFAYSIISALRFVIVDGKLVHGNIGPQSVFITPKGEFRLGGFELARPISEADGNRLMSDIESSKLTR
ncbi:hypothetical protein Pmar_PMAR006229 [Perkinsus marinus ATCC 50983]|uniref:Protein kinase domain-containing protein n=1 Tax=Perkinsus marinus (strain ATCC 50983 / TXsc) TaxID=423536 RepID=C5LAG3_PERM5|nr:hypothetical protein Pmar_PMAR006229 [Perkinsus marinus ATCC 50983]EER06419.1 hypothetical protein Pmar_PMAR006229 [Perkinsus marinus ATCC 50983]|eukprot:XP_002774603.1 hypothetical protein Pmar_PMAR006229 [Perkinsus marinus ATCC 50983]